jgi:DNA repair protein RecN (Recombination protein N)
VLKRLTIRDFGIIEALEWSPSEGLNVITGETGAGKSLVLDALDVLLGRRVGQEVIRSGASTAIIEAEVTRPAGDASAVSTRGSVVTLRREVDRSGRGNASVDGRAVPVRTMKELAADAFDLHGPNQQFSLLDAREQLALLDTFAGATELRSGFSSMADRLGEVNRRLVTQLTDQQQVVRRRDMLIFEMGEIRSAAVVAGEDDELGRESELLGNMDKLRDAVALACEQIYGGEQGIPSGSERIGEGLRQLREAAHLDRRLESLMQSVESALYQVEDAGRELGSYLDSLAYDPIRHEQVQQRLDVLRTLKKKYGATLEAVLAHADEAQNELASLDSSAESRERLEKERARLRIELAALGEQLSERRKAAASSLSANVQRELADLSMDGTGFTVSFGCTEGEEDLVLSDGSACGYTRDGIDDVEFLIRANPGEPYMPLARTASTGETSRLMLAVRCALSRGGPVPTLVFDEIDMGVGGRSGEVIGKKLATLARQHQVICITHLPQVAAYGDSQFRVQKRVVRNRTFVDITALVGAARESELSAMLGSLGEPSLFGAQELLLRAASWKRNLQC